MVVGNPATVLGLRLLAHSNYLSHPTIGGIKMNGTKQQMEIWNEIENGDDDTRMAS